MRDYHNNVSDCQGCLSFVCVLRPRTRGQEPCPPSEAEALLRHQGHLFSEWLLPHMFRDIQRTNEHDPRVHPQDSRKKIITIFASLRRTMGELQIVAKDMISRKPEVIAITPTGLSLVAQTLYIQ